MSTLEGHTYTISETTVCSKARNTKNFLAALEPGRGEPQRVWSLASTLILDF
jgi:hypothetical protein